MKIFIFLLLFLLSPAFLIVAKVEAEPSGDTYYHTLLALRHEREGKLEAALSEYQQALSADPESAFLLTQVGVMMARLNRPKEAVVLLEKAKSLQPSNIRALNVLGDLYAAAGETEKAMTTYEALIAQKPKEMEGYLVLARLFLAEKNVDRAIATLERGAKAAPESALGPYYLAKLFVQKKEYEKGLAQYQRAIALYPGFEKAHLEQGALYEEMKNPALAEKTYRNILNELNMEHEEAGLRVVHLLIQRKAFDDAIDVLTRLLQDDPKNLDLSLKLSLLWAEKKEFSKAIDSLKSVISEKPKSLELTLYLASLYEGVQSYDKALTTYQEALKKTGDHYETYLRVGALYFYRMKKLPDALSVAEKAKVKNPKRHEAYLFAGLILHESERFLEAAEQFARGIKIAPDRADLHFHLGVTYDKLNRFDALVSEMKAAIALDASHVMALNYLGYTYADRAIHLDEAVNLITRALALRPEDGYIMDSLGWAYYRQGKIKEGLALVQKAAVSVPNDPTILDHLGELYLKDNQKEQAYTAWRLSLKFDSKNEKLKVRIREAGFEKTPHPPSEM